MNTYDWWLEKGPLKYWIFLSQWYESFKCLCIEGMAMGVYKDLCKQNIPLDKKEQ